MFNDSFPVVNEMSLSHCFLLLLYCEKMSTLDLQWLFILLSIKVISLSIVVSRATCYHYFWRPAVQKWEVPIFYHLTDTLKSSTIAFLILFKVSRHISGCVTNHILSFDIILAICNCLQIFTLSLPFHVYFHFLENWPEDFMKHMSK